jgi:acetyl esterase/lipase
MFIRCVVFIWMASVLSAAELERLLLWPQGAPLAMGEATTDQPWLDVYPANKHQATGAAFLICPGGGYGGLASDHEGEQVARFFHSLGIDAFVLHYRLGTNGYHHPVQLMDVQRALRVVRSRAGAMKFDPAKVGIIGFSAGGHLTSMAATLFDEKPVGGTNDDIDQLSARPDVAVPCYPVISLSAASAHKGSRKNLLGPRNEDDALALSLSTETRVTEKTPPCFIFQTDDDAVVPAENAVAFYLACRKAKVPAELHIFKTGRHGVGLALSDPTLSAWPRLLTEWLRGHSFLNVKR